MTEVLLAAAFVVGIPLLLALIAWVGERGRPRPAERPARRETPGAALVVAVVLWAALTVLGVAVALSVDFYPTVMSEKGEDIAEAFKVLTVMAMPVFALVLAALIYGVLRQGYTSLPEDGPPMHGRGAFPLAWFLVTAALTVLVIIYPGLTSLSAVMEEEEDPDLLVHVEGMQWTWVVSYPELGVENVRELMLPVGRTVRFEITSRDVLHSFWVPAFLMKVDAVPGLTTRLSLRPTKMGSFEQDQTVRLQCAELCGLSHASMRIGVSVVSGADFDAWVEKQRAAQAQSAADAPVQTIVAKGLQFDVQEITVAAGRPAVFRFDNQDAGVGHRFAVYTDERAAQRGAAPLFASRLIGGPAAESFEFVIEKAGRYFVRCEVHPESMKGVLIATEERELLTKAGGR